MADAVLRQWNLLQKIPAHPRKISTSDLLTALNNEGIEIGMRTLQRDLLLLSQIFPLVQDDRSKPYGWSWSEYDAGKHLPGFSPSVAMALLLTQKFLTPTFPKGQLELIERQFKQAEHVLETLKSDDLLNWTEKVYIHPRGFQLQPCEISSEIASQIYEAVLIQKQLHVEYFSKTSNDIRSLTIKPLGLIFRDAMTYVICQSDEYDNYIQLALSRFKKILEVGGSFEYPADFSLTKFTQSGRVGFSLGNEEIEILLRFSNKAGSHLLETKINDSQTHELQDDAILINTTVANNKELRWWILAFGDGVEVLEPISLRDEIHCTLKNALKHYER
ncbi:hypothetical protein CYQ88_04540 [Hydrogenovibrio sp. SC-1]|uniref:helix-turn-helix transcriptional regulator n=1 Tax=Hydrogenovibrio sp. SC-1 TaxID=2065820 RepID=UPI000C7CD608|nr:WYL domain-containing protein [Hydrogenovibrio sp. SC-1]PLA74865.1 hypothetical protein CYQ88_04540 [Hydrogenovibrio sp. SC-1]